MLVGEIDAKVMKDVGSCFVGQKEYGTRNGRLGDDCGLEAQHSLDHAFFLSRSSE